MKLGRLPRLYSPSVPHLSALLAGRRQRLNPPPPAVDYTNVLPADMGMFGNDRLGDCTCAAAYHALQVWTANANPPIDTEADTEVISLYEEACGYNPANPSSDQGGCEQIVLQHLLNQGMPVTSGSGRHHIAAFVEVDPTNVFDVKTVIADAGLVYLGFNVPDYIMNVAPGGVWGTRPGTPNIIGGHAVIAAGYDSTALKIISWGRVYEMTWEFWAQFVDEAYMIADGDWIQSTGKTLAGLSLPDLMAQMQALKQAA